MATLSKLPWWSSLPLSLGSMLMSAFAPDAFPEWSRVLLFWAGVVLALVGIVAAAWHFRPSRQALKALIPSRSFTWHSSSNGEPERWLGMSRNHHDPIMVRGLQLSAKNRGHPIKEISGCVRSGITNQEFPMYLIIGGDPIPPNQTHGIPRGADFQIFVPFGPSETSWPGIKASEFLQNWSEFEFLMNYDGKRYSRRFSRKEVKNQIDWFEKVSSPGESRPGARRKENADDAG